MTYKIKHEKKVINIHKFKRIVANDKAVLCNVYLTIGGTPLSGGGVLLNNKVYIALPTGYYSYTVRNIGTHKDNLAYQPLYLINPF